MILVASEKVRRFIGRLDAGDKLPDTILEICRQQRISCGEIRGIGTLASVELSEWDYKGHTFHPSHTIERPLVLLQLLGNISERDKELMLHAHVLLSHQTREPTPSIQVVGGHLVRGVVSVFEYVLESFDDLLLLREKDADTGLPLWMDVATPNARPSLNPKALSQASAWEEMLDQAPEEEAKEPRPGDILNHPRFGTCRVLSYESDEKIHVRLPNSRTILLGLKVLKIDYAGQDGACQIFKVRVKG